MGQGSYIFCEVDSIKKEYPDYQRALADLEAKALAKATTKWKVSHGGLTPPEDQYGWTTILPALFDPNPATYGGIAFGEAGAPRDWRQYLSATGHQVILQGCRTGETIPEDFMVAWMGLMFPVKQLQISEIRWQTSDRKFVRVNIEELRSFNKPALVFEEGFVLNEEQAFHLFGYVEGVDYQRIVPLGSTLFRVIDKVLNAPGDPI